MTRHMPRILALLFALALIAPAAASADRTAEVSIMDDQLLLHNTRARIDAEMQTFSRLGVDRLRVSAYWNEIAPAALSRSRPSFNAADPNSPSYNFASLDRVVQSAVAHGLKVMVSITTPGPLWASANPKRDNLVWKPSAGEFGLFAFAVTQRYAALVDHWAIMNEPNQQQWLQPQSERRKAFAPHHYRAMVHAAYPRIKSADPTSLVLIGELASVGSDAVGVRRGVKPLRFLRTMACRDGRYRRVRRGSCRSFSPIPGDAIGHHPYQFTDPSRRSFTKDEAAMGDGLRILRVVDALQRRRAFTTMARFDLYYTEFGYQTNPPDPYAGVSLRQQSVFLQKAAYLVWRTPRIKEINQFRLSDGLIDRSKGRKGFLEFQSGLQFADRRDKPSMRSFPHPFFINRDRFWGQIRPGAGHVVQIQHKRRRSGRYRLVAQVLTNSRGYFGFRLRGRKRGYYRYRWGSPPQYSGVIRLRR